MAAATLALAPTPAVLDGERSIEDPKSMIHRREGATPARRKAWRANPALLASAAAAGCAADAYYQAAQDLQVQNPHAALIAQFAQAANDPLRLETLETMADNIERETELAVSLANTCVTM